MTERHSAGKFPPENVLSADNAGSGYGAPVIEMHELCRVSEPLMHIIDTHQHIWDLDLFSYAWCKGIPALNRSFRIEDYRKATQGISLLKSVHVEADVDEPFMLGETRYILTLAEGENPIAGVVACGRPEKPDFPVYLNKIAGHPKLKGIRRVLHTQPDQLIAKEPLFIEHVRLLSDYNLSFDICALAQQLPVIIDLVNKCPKVSFILDHCGVPQVKEKVFHPWRDYIREMARSPNVVCKISGLVAYADPEKWTPDDLRPYIEYVIHCFGWERVMFGSDWPVCTLSASLQDWVDALLFITEGAGAAERQKLFSDNAARIYRLGSTENLSVQK